jgi:L-galactose dehydrogenase
VLGRALQGITRESYLLATKVGRYGSDIEDFDFSAGRVRRSVDESLGRLGVEHVDFIQVHDMEFGSITQIVGETLPALQDVKKAGKARFVGITGLPVHLFREVMEQAEVDQIQSYCHYCLNDTALVDALPFLQEHGVGIFNSAPLAMRLLSADGPPDWHPAPVEVRQQCSEAARICRERGGDLGKLALQFSLRQPAIHTTVVGTASPRRVEENVSHAQEALDEELLLEVRRILAPAHNVTWPSGRPENNR